ncbi:unnamed protein product [Allacma fusca]|uniref:Uncharacterized protein n=1 Tax=Allacma fusca TaxID=39272 RepID=A0A8J2J4N8_9HEXA|nr:unnamed protein product [Allacma fusca]
MPRERIRAHMPSSATKFGRGVPPLFNHLINTPTESDNENEGEELDNHWKFLQGISQQWRGTKNTAAFQKFCTEILELDEFIVDHQEGSGIPPEPSKADDGIDMGVMDKYIEGIVIHREIIAEECLDIKKSWDLMTDQKARLMSSISRLARLVYNGNENSYLVAESCIPMYVWILNKPKLPKDIHLLTMKGLSEMLYNSKRLKKKFAVSKGTKVVIHCMREMPIDPELACWACYTLAMAAINSAEIISQAKMDPGLLDLVSEFAFDIYWFNWPINYGSVLRGIFFGPTPPSERETFQFI